MKGIALLGATGSIGTKCLDVIRRHPSRFSIIALTTKTQVDVLLQQAREFRPALCVAGSAEGAEQLRAGLQGTDIRVGVDLDGLLQAAAHPATDLVVNALVGAAGLLPTVKAIEAGKTVALANKESLVMAGSLIMSLARQHNVEILPIDSEHCGIRQCLQGNTEKDISRIILTASGGPFLNRDPDDFEAITPREALAHPTWDMGPKITVDSATLMNKGFEVIEAHWLFGLPTSRIEVIIHPQSVVHALVELTDGSVLAQMGVSDMRLPIQYALGYPERLEPPCSRLDLAQVNSLSFRPPDHERFPCLGLAYHASEAGGTMPAVLNAANEIAVEQFLMGRLSFTRIPAVIEKALDDHHIIDHPSLDDILETDRWAREYAAARCSL